MDNLPKGFITVDKAIELIEKDTRKVPVVDTSFMVRNYNYIREGGNFTIPLLKRADDGKIVNIGNTWVHFDDEEMAWKFRGALKRHYKEVAGREVNETPVHSYTTAYDSEKDSPALITVNKKPFTKAGEDLGSGNQEVQG